jgi:UDP-N-acetyl-D-galactosamine dehydrogenase
VAEAAKVVENTQRDANIALINEFALIFHKLGIDTTEVLEAAGTKWNFLPFRPGLVGGHCIGVDPYYLIQKAQSTGYYPDILLACRRINDRMGRHIAGEVIKLMIQRGIAIAGSRILLLGITFKENCPDLRNTRVIDLVRELEEYGAGVDIHDPWADAAVAAHEYGVRLLTQPPVHGTYDAIVVAVAHDEFRAMGVEGLRALANGRAVIYDIKGMFPKDQVDARL